MVNISLLIKYRQENIFRKNALVLQLFKDAWSFTELAENPAPMSVHTVENHRIYPVIYAGRLHTRGCMDEILQLTRCIKSLDGISSAR